MIRKTNKRSHWFQGKIDFLTLNIEESSCSSISWLPLDHYCQLFRIPVYSVYVSEFQLKIESNGWCDVDSDRYL